MMSNVCIPTVERQVPGGGLAEIFRRYLKGYLRHHRLSPLQKKVVTAIRACRTSALGGHVFRCKECGYRRHEYDSCRNRHCPKCQGYQKIKWVAARLSELLPIPYYHTVFTMPHSLNDLALYNKELIYDMFFKATSQALHAFAEDPRFLGARLGFMGILHTWGQALNHHIHLHYIVTGGGLSADGKRWVNLPYRKKFLFPRKAVSMRVRKVFANLLWKAYTEGKLVFPDKLAYLEEPSAFDRFLKEVSWQNWLCYMKEPFGSAQIVVKYIGRYTHRVAISDARIKSISDAEIMFAYKRYHNNKIYPRTMKLSPEQFIQRFLLHIIPHGFKRIRHYGFLASGVRTKSLALANKLFLAASHKLSELKTTLSDWFSDKPDKFKCPACGQGILEVCELIAPIPLRPG